MKELKRVRFEYKIDGEVYSVRKPTVEEMKALQEKEKSDLDGGIDESLNFLAKLGLPVEIGNTLEDHMIQEIIEDLSGGKKS